uniref:REC114 meiotic recombination protein n=1 Tax=Salvator merianae TaxID=96440 RepID=A0A8D0DPR7_SALMN
MATGSSNINCVPEFPLTHQLQAAEETQGASSCLSGAEWSLKRYGRFMPATLGTASGSWKVLESSKESGFLVLTIVISGHFFISKGKEVLEGFSLIDASQWLKIVRNADSLLFGSKTRNERRMFRVQFVGDSTTSAEEHCTRCVQKLDDYLPIQVMDAAREELQQGHSTVLVDESQRRDADQNIENLPQTQERVSVSRFVQSALKATTELPLAYQQSKWNAEDLGSFIRLCLLDQGFPAFVEEVEKQLKKITDG